MTQAQPLIQTLPMTLGAHMSDDPSNPTAIEIPLQIELPNGQTLFAAVALGGLPFDGQRQIAERMAAAWNAFAGVDTQEIQAPVKCLHQIAEPAPTESVLIDGTAYVVHAEVAAELLRLHIELQTAPQAVQATEEMRVCNSEECGWIGPLSETYGYKNSPATLCPECKETTELSAPAHPAEGVPAQPINERVAFDDFFRQRNGLHPDTDTTFRSDAAEPWKYWKARAELAATQPAAQGLDAQLAKLTTAYKELSGMFHDQVVAQQAAWIEWKHGNGAEDAMQWIENGLCGPGHIPDEDEPYGKEAQAWFDANKSDPIPVCACGRPSNTFWMGHGFCSEAHYDEFRAAQAKQGGA